MLERRHRALTTGSVPSNALPGNREAVYAVPQKDVRNRARSDGPDVHHPPLGASVLMPVYAQVDKSRKMTDHGADAPPIDERYELGSGAFADYDDAAFFDDQKFNAFRDNADPFDRPEKIFDAYEDPGTLVGQDGGPFPIFEGGDAYPNFDGDGAYAGGSVYPGYGNDKSPEQPTRAGHVQESANAPAFHPSAFEAASPNSNQAISPSAFGANDAGAAYDGDGNYDSVRLRGEHFRGFDNAAFVDFQPRAKLAPVPEFPASDRTSVDSGLYQRVDINDSAAPALRDEHGPNAPCATTSSSRETRERYSNLSDDAAYSIIPHEEKTLAREQMFHMSNHHVAEDFWVRQEHVYQEVDHDEATITGRVETSAAKREIPVTVL